jgi:hypothetical protein
MSQETVVNRVQQTSHFATESAKLEVVPQVTEELKWTPVVSIDLNDPTKMYEQVPQTAEAQRVGQVGSIEESDDNIGNIAEPANLAFAKALLGLGYEQPESFTQFKTRVIAAFRHMGLDTRRFFQE